MQTRALGYSLAEVVVSTGLIAILAVVLSSLVTSQLRISSKAGLKIAVDRSHLLLQESLRQDILTTTGAGVSLEPAGAGIAFQPVLGVSPDAELAYSKKTFIAYRYGPEPRLQRWFWEGDTPVTLASPPQRLSPGQWTDLLKVKPARTGSWTGLKNFRARSEAAGGEISPRLWIDCIWLDKEREWSMSYCIYTRQYQ